MPSPKMPKSVPSPQHRHLFIVYGPAGCGKSTVGESIAKAFGFPYIEGDMYHTPEAVEKMSDNIPLTDGDRWDWLIKLREQAVAEFEQNQSGVVLTCSALKQKYRDVIRMISLNDHDVLVHFIYLRADPQVLLQRVRARRNHYMKDSMVKSQLNILEEPDRKEKDVSSIDVGADIPEVRRLACELVSGIIAKDS
jgi:gluconokinase